MHAPRKDPLLLAGKTLTLLIQGAMALAAAVIVLVVPAILFSKDEINAEVIAEVGPDALAMPILPLMLLLASVLVVVALVFLFFGKLRGIIDTVAAGDPFVPENADRLAVMAWLQIAIYVAKLAAERAAVGMASWANQFREVKVDTSFDIDVIPILLVLVLFILARVFRHGAAMREDLEGTV
ncbi:DUF2975 domain-containing protein [Porphyrobacter sp. YT40]|uniref:DUF2975 domain-containing protein n=1 Tax=Porphyrobacter sp. YT40 TaxID=2547601 RepID=UPI0011447F1C|nr:DUF2975 domain-containing protein [Porphyrobacter sp. YT40]QDH33649.1 DUF2975 domain-containing protein [Porphyrobacter sp. YT40]